MDELNLHDIMGHMIRTDRFHRATCDRELASLALHRSQMRMLMNLARNAGAMSQRALADDMHISAAVVTVTLNKLEKEGYVTRTPSFADRRTFTVSLTEKGQQMVDEARGRLNYVDGIMLQDFTEEEKRQLVGFYTRMLSNLASLGEVTEK